MATITITLQTTDIEEAAALLKLYQGAHDRLPVGVPDLLRDFYRSAIDHYADEVRRHSEAAAA